MSYGVDVYANKATPVVKDRSKWANAGPAGEAVKDLLEIEDAVTTAIFNGAETYEELYASLNADVKITGYDVDEVGDLFDEFCADNASEGLA